MTLQEAIKRAGGHGSAYYLEKLAEYWATGDIAADQELTARVFDFPEPLKGKPGERLKVEIPGLPGTFIDFTLPKEVGEGEFVLTGIRYRVAAASEDDQWEDVPESLLAQWTLDLSQIKR